MQGLADYSPINSRTGFLVRYGSYSKKETKHKVYIFSHNKKSWLLNSDTPLDVLCMHSILQYKKSFPLKIFSIFMQC